MRRLILRPGAIGDFIVSLPALHHLRAAYTEVWTTEANLPLVRFADRVRTLVSTGIDTLGIPGITPNPSLLATLRGFDSIVSWYGAARDEFRAAVRHLPFQFHTALPPQGSPCHAVDYYLSQVGAPHGAIPRLPVIRNPQPFAIIHPFSGGRQKNWPLHRFHELARSLTMPVHFTAGPEEQLDGATRFDNLWDLAQWIATASLYIGNDSGITHLAAATDVPVLALFGPTNPAIWAPRGPNVTVLSACRMEDVTLEQVLQHVTPL